MPSYIRIASSRILYLDNNGNLAAGYKVYTCVPGTDTLASSWQNKELSVLNANPIILDARGQAQIFTDTAVKLVFCTPASTGPTDGVIQSDDYLQEQTETNIDVADADPGTTYNQYEASTTPPYGSISEGFMLILIPDTDNIDTMGTQTFTGSGKNDIVMQGPYTGTTAGSIFTIEIESSGTPDTIKWKKDGGSYVTGVSLTGMWQNLIEGIKFRSSEISGHTPGDIWTVEVTTPARLDFCGLGSDLIYKNMAGTLQALDGGDLKNSIPATLVRTGASSWILNNPATETIDEADISGLRERKQVSINYTLLTDDAGNIIDCLNATDIDITLEPATDYNGMFFYIRAGGVGNVVLVADGSEVIYSQQNPDGDGSYIIIGGSGYTIQLQSNGVSWEVLIEPTSQITVQSWTTAGTYTGAFVKTPGKKFFLSIVLGAGGGGGAGGGSLYAGGGGGGCAIELLEAGDIGAAETVTVGAAGTAGTSGGDGGNGGTSSFGSLSSATGGTGGKGNTASGGGGAGGTAAGGDYNYTGQVGYDADHATLPGLGGDAYGMYGGKGGGPGGNYGGGGSGGPSAGYAGAVGAVYVYEFPENLRYLADLIMISADTAERDK